MSQVYATHTSIAARTRRGATPEAASHTADSQQAGYDLFRRAILLHDGDAWTEISAHFRPMLINWASQCSAHGSSDEQCDEIADRALARAWSALTPERFGQFPSLAALLAYLRTCVTATAIDAARAQLVRERAYGKLEASPIATPEELVLDELERGDLWQAALGATTTEQERVVLIESFRRELPPRDILARHPNLFADIGEVYLTKRHLLGRLQRSPEVRRFLNG